MFLKSSDSGCISKTVRSLNDVMAMMILENESLIIAISYITSNKFQDKVKIELNKFENFDRYKIEVDC